MFQRPPGRLILSLIQVGPAQPENDLGIAGGQLAGLLQRVDRLNVFLLTEVYVCLQQQGPFRFGFIFENLLHQRGPQGPIHHSGPDLGFGAGQNGFFPVT